MVGGCSRDVWVCIYSAVPLGEATVLTQFLWHCAASRSVGDLANQQCRGRSAGDVINNRIDG